MASPWRPPVLLALACALAVSGCGGGGSHGSATPGKNAKPALTRPQFLARANAICRRGRLRARRVAKPTDLVSYARSTRTLLNIATRIRDDISDLDPPAADQGIVDSYLAALEAPIRELRRVRIAAYKEDHGEVVRRAQRYRQVSVRANRIAEGFGMTDCAGSAQ